MPAGILWFWLCCDSCLKNYLSSSECFNEFQCNFSLFVIPRLVSGYFKLFKKYLQGESACRSSHSVVFHELPKLQIGLVSYVI